MNVTEALSILCTCKGGTGEQLHVLLARGFTPLHRKAAHPGIECMQFRQRDYGAGVNFLEHLRPCSHAARFAIRVP